MSREEFWSLIEQSKIGAEDGEASRGTKKTCRACPPSCYPELCARFDV